jgi:hypothetical protein
MEPSFWAAEGVVLKEPLLAAFARRVMWCGTPAGTTPAIRATNAAYVAESGVFSRLLIMLLHQNLWAAAGSGKAPRVW